MTRIREWLMVVVGHLVGTGETLLRGRRRPATETGQDEVPDLDKTGRVVAVAQKIPVRWREGDLLFPSYDSLAHSFWRAQEISLFNRARDHLQTPVLDVGCGDGSFASLIFDHIEYGLDKDPAALETAKAYNLYGTLVTGTDESIPLPGGAAGSAICNSVFEHVVDLDPLLLELSRVVRPGGLLAFTVPVKAFDRHLTHYFGGRFSRNLNAEYHHRNLLEPAEWTVRLARAGFEPVETLAYQPPGFTFGYVMLRYAGSRRGLGRWLPGLNRTLWRLLGSRLTSMLRDSLAGRVTDGANLFVLARRS
jgi:SAM-dependent methyltransferase